MAHPTTFSWGAVTFLDPQVYALEKSRHYARDTLFRLERSWAEKQFRLVNFILNVPHKEPQPERFRRPAAARHRQPKLEYISKDSGTYVLSGKAPECQPGLQWQGLLTWGGGTEL